MNGKSPDAFRTISEVAEWLGVNPHVLRFWESKFTQIRPVKRAGGRRYYRPSDMELLGGIQKLLHEDGMTIRGVQKILREQGTRAVAAHSKPIDGMLSVLEDAGPADPGVDDRATAPLPGPAAEAGAPPPRPEGGQPDGPQSRPMPHFGLRKDAPVPPAVRPLGPAPLDRPAAAPTHRPAEPQRGAVAPMAMAPAMPAADAAGHPDQAEPALDAETLRGILARLLALRTRMGARSGTAPDAGV